MKKVLIISPQFAPVNSPDSHRVRHMLHYFGENGWSPEIITVKINCLEKPVLDSRLLRTIPSNTIIHFVSAFHYKWTRKIGLGSLSIRSFYFYFRFLAKILKNGNYDLIFFSTTAFHLLALGPVLKRKYRVPFVLDIQDPWRSDFYLDKPKSERPPKFLLNYYIDKYLETYTIPKADGIISVSEDYIKTFKKRFNRLTQNLLVVPFAASSHDYFDIDDMSFNLEKREEGVSIVYVGRGGHDLRYSISCFFEALKKIEQSNIGNSRHFVVSFVGTSYAPSGEGVQTIKPISDNFKLKSKVIEQTDRIGYFEAISRIQKADILFIPGSTDPSYTASKIYPYILSDKPIIACFHENSSAVNILHQCTKTNVVTFNSNLNTDEIVFELFNEMEHIILNLGNQNWNHNNVAMNNYMAPAMTKKICTIFDKVING